MSEVSNTVFLSKFCGMYAKQNMDRNWLNKLRSALKFAIEIDLFEHEAERLCITRDIHKTKKLDIKINTSCISIFKNKKERANLSVIAPSWQYILRNRRSKIDELSYDIISDFFIKINQYIYRSKQVDVLVGLTLEYNKFYDFRKGSVSYEIIKDVNFFNFNYLNSNSWINDSRRIKTIKKYLKIINNLDPYVHISSFYFMKAIHLKNKYLYEESINSLSNMLESIRNFLIKSKALLSKSKDLAYDVCSKLDASDSTLKALQYLHSIRCKVTAHPASAYWWDFGEIHEDNIDILINHASIILRKFFLFEYNNRRIEANPVNWAKWFSENSHIMIDVVWNDSYPAL